MISWSLTSSPSLSDVECLSTIFNVWFISMTSDSSSDSSEALRLLDLVVDLAWFFRSLAWFLDNLDEF
ncbi:hypothetical protein WICPIJ_010150 [Wickerhamomyces pijperi]|uniref:Uncharacterized protein n=1 Tax=Wickerhamomyces pijperi TaxID=599730 RepID=A0A9P8TAN7_WICPI|nr:hypothetical protein WICPIJ_010150 [Wickerhamomyces pijperi]